MSYVIEVKRSGDKASLTSHDFERLVKTDISFISIDDQVIVWNRSQDGNPLQLNVESDRLWTDGIYGDSQATYLSKLRQIAQFLDAQVIGEEGEDLTAELPEDFQHSRNGFAKIVGLILFVVMIPVIAITFVVRLPWMIWKLSRTLKSH